jgi:hypothetical protein
LNSTLRLNGRYKEYCKIIKTREIFLVVCLCILISACNPSTINSRFGLSPTQTSTPEPLCEQMSKYRVGIAELNKPVSKCNLYFYVVTENLEDGEKIIYVLVQPDKPFEFDEKGFLKSFSMRTIQPTSYKWSIKNRNGETERSWYSQFFNDRVSDYSLITLPDEDWKNSFIDVFFEDINYDRTDENVTYTIAVGEFLSIKMPNLEEN